MGRHSCAQELQTSQERGEKGKEKRVYLFIFLIEVFLFKVFQLEAEQPHVFSCCHLVIYC